MGTVVYVWLLTFVLICTSTEEAEEKNTRVSKRKYAVFQGGHIEEKAIQKDCLIDEQLYLHGQILPVNKSRPCNKYRCVNGVAKIIEEGCYHHNNERCYSLGATVLQECIMYKCVKKSRGKDEDSAIYHFRNIGQSRCKDYYGLCRSPGEKGSLKKNDRFYPVCVCRQVNSVMVEFDCQTK